MRIKRALCYVGLVMIWALSVRAAPLSEVRGVVLDPKGSFIQSAHVILRSKTSGYPLTDKTNEKGEFLFIGVASGKYVVSVEATSFVKAEKTVRLVSGSSPEIHFQLEIMLRTENVSVTPISEEVGAETPTPTTLIGKEQIKATPGAARSGSVRVITSYVPGSYMIHNQLHVHGRHQVSWLVDGVPLPTTTGVDVGTPFNINDTDYLEARRGSYSVEYGDRTYGVFSIVPRAEGWGGISGGLNENADSAVPLLEPGLFSHTDPHASTDRFLLDHDQRHTLTLGTFLSLPWNSYLFGELHYGSGFADLGDEDHEHHDELG